MNSELLDLMEIKKAAIICRFLLPCGMLLPEF